MLFLEKQSLFQSKPGSFEDYMMERNTNMFHSISQLSPAQHWNLPVSALVLPGALVRFSFAQSSQKNDPFSKTPKRVATTSRTNLGNENQFSNAPKGHTT